MSDKDIQLSRRKVLAGLGTIGIASAGAGLGTTAWLSDQESFLNNVLTAGTLDLIVDYSYMVDQAGMASDTDGFVDGVNNGGEGEEAGGSPINFVIDDVKPGDSGKFEFCFRIHDNPAYLWACASNFASAEAVDGEDDFTEPEAEVADPSEDGDLEESIQATLSYCIDGEPIADAPTYTGTIAEVLAELNGGFALDGDPTTEARDAFQPGDGADNPCVCIDWNVPTEVGNEIQGDTFSFDVVFHAVQSRHNDGTANPCAECDVVTGEGWGKSEEFDGGVESSYARGRFGDNLAAGAWEVALGEVGATPIDQANYVWTSGATVPFSYTYDGTTATFTLDGTPVSGAIPAPNGKIGIQTKADEATIAVENLVLKNASDTTVLSGQSVSATNDGEGRDLQYLVYSEDCIDAAEGFTLEGEVTVTVQDDYSGDEGVAFDVMIE